MKPTPQCPIRPGEPCTLCQLDVTGPENCPLVYLVMHDDELREQLHEFQLRKRRQSLNRRSVDV